MWGTLRKSTKRDISKGKALVNAVIGHFGAWRVIVVNRRSHSQSGHL